MTETPGAQPQADEPEITAERWRKEAAAMGEQFLARRRQLARALGEPDGMPFAPLIEVARQQHDDLTAERAAHEEHRRGMASVLDLPPGADWLAVTRRVTELRYELEGETERADRAERESEDRLLRIAAAGRRADAVQAEIGEMIAQTHDLRDQLHGAETRAAQAAELLDTAEQAGNEAERARLAAVARADRAEAAVADYENRTSWETTCGEHARLLDALQAAEVKLDRVRRISRRLAAHAVGFQDALDETDRDPWARTVGADIDALGAALDGGSEQTQPDPCAHGCRDAADAHTRLSEQLDTDAREQAAEPERVPDLSIDVIVRTPLSPQQIEDAIVAAAQSGFITIRSAT